MNLKNTAIKRIHADIRGIINIVTRTPLKNNNINELYYFSRVKCQSLLSVLCFPTGR